METQGVKKRAQRAFTLVELLAVIGMVALLFCLTLPALAHAKIKSPAAGCLSTMRQMMVGWSMYKEDNMDVLMPNAPQNQIGLGWLTPNSSEGWSGLNANTNVALLLSGLMGPYVGNDVRAFKCPADVVPSANGQRLRSRSMNGMMGLTPGSSYGDINPAWRLYSKGSDITCPTPANAWVFCDESPYTINDGYLQLDLDAPEYPDLPASYHGKACGFSFADGHVEDHRWVSTFILVPVIYGMVNNGAVWPSSVRDLDYIWLRQHAACKIAN